MPKYETALGGLYCKITIWTEWYVVACGNIIAMVLKNSELFHNQDPYFFLGEIIPG